MQDLKNYFLLLIFNSRSRLRMHAALNKENHSPEASIPSQTYCLINKTCCAGCQQENDIQSILSMKQAGSKRARDETMVGV